MLSSSEMGNSSILPVMVICMLNFLVTGNAGQPNKALETYIVNVEPGLRSVSASGDLESWYGSFLPKRSSPWYAAFLPSSWVAGDDEPRLVHAYRTVLSGFAAKLSPEDAKTVKQTAGVASLRPERVLPLFTTYTPKFLGLIQNLGFWNVSNYGRGVIIGVLDTGITPGHPSFSDEGVPQPPAKWKGKCDFRSRQSCNNKLIGARAFQTGGSPSDSFGHGSHTASTAAGNFVAGANVFGNANGTAAGIAPMAHVAMYKVCYEDGCPESDLIAGMDAAINDGVDILSLSLGAIAAPFPDDFIAIGTYKAVEKGIFVSTAAGNSGPDEQTASNLAPWMLTVGASTIDRSIVASVVLGNNQELLGESCSNPRQIVVNKSEVVFPQSCDNLERNNVTGKIVVCELITRGRIAKGVNVKQAGGAGMILINGKRFGDTTFADVHVLPVVHLSFANGIRLKLYLKSTQNPTASIGFKGTKIGDKHAPIITSFSSRGPNSISPGILKPDIVGPGHNILAAWPVSVDNNNKSKSTFNIISGTSMSCPHLTGVAALLKSAHPEWSPAAIKSAIMTTADQINHGGKKIFDQTLHPASIFATGSGHVNILHASDPGLIYDTKPDDYIPYLCGLGYTNEQVKTIVQKTVDCSKKKIPDTELNYPSFSFTLGPSPQTYTRTVTNVGDPNSSYEVKITLPEGVNIKVEPTKLEFKKANQQLSYKVTFTQSSGEKTKNKYGQGLISWNSAKYTVKSPVAVTY